MSLVYHTLPSRRVALKTANAHSDESKQLLMYDPYQQVGVVRAPLCTSSRCASVVCIDYAPTEYNAAVADNETLTVSISGPARPVNPVGRTGLTGRGMFAQWGGNQIVAFVITRFVRKDNAVQLQMLQACNEGDSKSTAALVCTLPMYWTSGGVCGITTVDTRQAMLDELRTCSQFAATCLESAINTAVLAWSGALEHPLNTDNAWLFIDACFVHCGTVLANALDSIDALDTCRWIEYTGAETQTQLCLELAKIVDTTLAHAQHAVFYAGVMDCAKEAPNAQHKLPKPLAATQAHKWITGPPTQLAWSMQYPSALTCMDMLVLLCLGYVMYSLPDVCMPYA